MEGVAKCTVNLEAKTATVELDKEVDSDVLMNTVKEAGYEPISIA